MDDNYNDFLKKYQDNDYCVYEMSFDSLLSLYEYLKSKPSINRRIWYYDEDVASINNEKAFAGEKLEKAIEYCLYGYEEKYDLFLELQHHLDNLVLVSGYGMEYEPSYVGSRFNIPNIVAGNPKTRYRLVSNEETRFVTIHFNLGYPHHTTRKAILNRGVITLNLIKLLEMNNYQVDFKAYELSEFGSEMIYINVLLKKSGELLNTKKCYFPLTSREFLRRILFRVLETMPVRNNWKDGYGWALDTNKMRNFLNIPSQDIVISYPSDHNINGDNIYRDAYNFFSSIKLDDNINMEEIKRMLKRKI